MAAARKKSNTLNRKKSRTSSRASKSSQRKKNPFLPDSARRFLWALGRRALGLGLIILSGALIVSLFTYHITDPSLNTQTTTDVKNALGIQGAYVADLLVQGVGLASGLLVLVIFTWGCRFISGQVMPRALLRLILLPIMLGLGAVAFACLPTPDSWPLVSSLGGFSGMLMLDHSLGWLPSLGGWTAPILAISLFGLCTILLLFIGGATRHEMAHVWFNVRQIASYITFYLATITSMIWATVYNIGVSLFDLIVGLLRKESDQQPVKRTPKPKRQKKVAVPKINLTARKEPTLGSTKATAKESKSKSRLKSAHTESDFTLPDSDLLNEIPMHRAAVASREQLEENARLLESVLADFGVQGEIVKVSPGPVVTLYELEPAAGVKSSRVVALADDIARSMSAISARVAVVPGKNAIGIELPNDNRETVYLREMLETKDYKASQTSLPLLLGKDIGGDPIMADLSKMPHLLVAGTTGSGKSVAINTMLMSLLYKRTPDECRMIMIDPKMLELSVYDDIPHLLTPVVTDPKKAVVALKWCVREMEDRYRAMSHLKVRNIDGYNERLAQARDSGEELKRQVQTGFDPETGRPIMEEQPLDLKPLPYIVVVVDEMADLMLVAGKDIEAAIQRLAQMARAAGIHLIMATQRPSVDVITGTVKANFPTRISFQVTSKIDSRTILGEQGAEQLLGQGDMLYMASGGRTTRVHGPFVTDDEVESVVKYLKSQGHAQYLDTVTVDTGDDDEGGEGFSTGGNTGSGDALLDKAIELVLNDQKASISYVQRRLRIGYNKAADLVERMEEEGILSAPNSAGKREILGGRPGE